MAIITIRKSVDQFREGTQSALMILVQTETFT